MNSPLARDTGLSRKIQGEFFHQFRRHRASAVEEEEESAYAMEEGPWEEIFGGSAEEEAFPVGTERRDGG